MRRGQQRCLFVNVSPYRHSFCLQVFTEGGKKLQAELDTAPKLGPRAKSAARRLATSTVTKYAAFHAFHKYCQAICRCC